MHHVCDGPEECGAVDGERVAGVGLEGRPVQLKVPRSLGGEVGCERGVGAGAPLEREGARPAPAYGVQSLGFRV